MVSLAVGQAVAISDTELQYKVKDGDIVCDLKELFDADDIEQIRETNHLRKVQVYERDEEGKFVTDSNGDKVPLKDKLGHLVYDYRIKEGMVLTIQGSFTPGQTIQTHKLAKGETVKSLQEKWEVSSTVIRHANRTVKPITAGKTVRIPFFANVYAETKPVALNLQPAEKVMTPPQAAETPVREPAQVASNTPPATSKPDQSFTVDETKVPAKSASNLDDLMNNALDAGKKRIAASGVATPEDAGTPPPSTAKTVPVNSDASVAEAAPSTTHAASPPAKSFGQWVRTLDNVYWRKTIVSGHLNPKVSPQARQTLEQDLVNIQYVADRKDAYRAYAAAVVKANRTVDPNAKPLAIPPEPMDPAEQTAKLRGMLQVSAKQARENHVHNSDEIALQQLEKGVADAWTTVPGRKQELMDMTEELRRRCVADKASGKLSAQQFNEIAYRVSTELSLAQYEPWDEAVRLVNSSVVRETTRLRQAYGDLSPEATKGVAPLNKVQ